MRRLVGSGPTSISRGLDMIGPRIRYSSTPSVKSMKARASARTTSPASIRTAICRAAARPWLSVTNSSHPVGSVTWRSPTPVARIAPLTGESVRPHAMRTCVRHMRWDNLKISHAGEEQAHLAGYRDPAVVRRFDAPEAMNIRFYEIRAKSALNRVPEQSYVPFRWTVNPYRGCSHACTYCAVGETPILTADGRTRPLADLAVGDRIIGTERVGRYRRYVETEVRDHWSTEKPAYRVTLEDGTALITSGDHRFLTNRGWKHVTGAMA